MNTLAGQTLASIVTDHSSVAPIFEKYNLDFCCKGKRPLYEACLEKGLSFEQVAEEIETAFLHEQKKQMDFKDMTAEQIISYITIHHHFYVKQSMPTIFFHIDKVATKHGSRFPYMVKVRTLFDALMHEMSSHMQKEEQVLFPRIKEVEAFVNNEQVININTTYISAPVQVMEHEHDLAGDIVQQIRELTNNYEVPSDACTTFRLCLTELQEFEEDLHKHVHLENSILFPLANQLAKKLGADKPLAFDSFKSCKIGL